jgi:hypothetical protein
MWHHRSTLLTSVRAPQAEAKVSLDSYRPLRYGAR